MKDNEQDWGPSNLLEEVVLRALEMARSLAPPPPWPCPSLSHSPELSLQIHKVLPGQH